MTRWNLRHRLLMNLPKHLDTRRNGTLNLGRLGSTGLPPDLNVDNLFRLLQWLQVDIQWMLEFCYGCICKRRRLRSLSSTLTPVLIMLLWLVEYVYDKWIYCNGGHREKPTRSYQLRLLGETHLSSGLLCVYMCVISSMAWIWFLVLLGLECASIQK